MIERGGGTKKTAQHSAARWVVHGVRRHAGVVLVVAAFVMLPSIVLAGCSLPWYWSWVVLAFVVLCTGVHCAGVAYVVRMWRSSCGCGVRRGGIRAGGVFIALAFVVLVLLSSSCVFVAHITVSTTVKSSVSNLFSVHSTHLSYFRVFIKP